MLSRIPLTWFLWYYCNIFRLDKQVSSIWVRQRSRLVLCLKLSPLDDVTIDFLFVTDFIKHYNFNMQTFIKCISPKQIIFRFIVRHFCNSITLSFTCCKLTAPNQSHGDNFHWWCEVIIVVLVIEFILATTNCSMFVYIKEDQIIFQ